MGTRRAPSGFPCVHWPVLAAALLLASTGEGQFALTTTYASDNGQAGNMFDLVALNAVQVCTFDVNLDPGTWDIDVYTKSGSYLPAVNSPSAWGPPLASLNGIVSNGLNVPTPLQLSLGVSIPSGGQQAFYLTVTNGNAMNYTSGAPGSTGTVYTADANLQVLVGAGVGWPFTGNFFPRIWNGTVHYVTSGSCPPPLFQRNQPQASMDINGVQTSGNEPALARGCVGSPAVVSVMSPLAGAGFEIGITLDPLVPRGGPGSISTPRQTLNLYALSPTLVFLHGGSIHSFEPFPGPFNVPLTLPVPLTVSAQLAIEDPAHPEFYVFSQGVSYEAFHGAILPGPTGDDTSVAVGLAVPPLCLDPVRLYGTSYATVYVSSNGRLNTVAADDDFSPTVSEALTDNPFVGAWSDFDPSMGGSIRIDGSTPGQIDFVWDGVAPFGSPPGVQTGIRLSYAFSGQTWTLADIPRLSANPNVTFLGLSVGNLGATNAGQQLFAPGMSGVPATATAMLYQFGAGASLATVTAGTSSIVLTPTTLAGSPAYSWMGF